MDSGAEPAGITGLQDSGGASGIGVSDHDLAPFFDPPPFCVGL
jgi:hypothetical protein